MPFAVAAGVSAVAGIAGAAMQSSAVSGAADKAQQTQREAQEATRQAQAQMRSDLLPYMTAGTNALAPAQALLGLNGPEAAANAMQGFQQSPGYQFQLDQGLRAIDAGASARGMLRSGATIKAEERLGQDLASQEFGTYYNRMMNLASLGQNAAAGVGNGAIQANGQNALLAGGIAQTQMSEGSAQASIYGNVAQGIGNLANSYSRNSLYSGAAGMK